jgi:hypothetical protein
MTIDAKGRLPESWNCIDCGINTAPGLFNRVEMERALTTAEAAAAMEGRPGKGSVDQRVGADTEVYYVRDKVRDASGIEGMGGCLCIGCLEKRIGRELKPRDFPRWHAFNSPNFPGTKRLRQRRGF